MLLEDVTHEFEIHRFMIDFQYQGRWYGKQALNEIIKYIQKISQRTNRIKLMFLEDNIRAEKLYTSVGFIDSGETEWNERWKFREKIFYYEF